MYAALQAVRDRFSSTDRGATAVEYGLLVGLIAVVIIGAVFALGGTLDGMFNEVNQTILNPGGGAPADG